MAQCAIYPVDKASWAWQPFGLDVKTFSLLGCHYRGFPVIKIGDEAKSMIEQGREVRFTYKGKQYACLRGEVTEVVPMRVIVEDGQRFVVFG